jgi:hypothetical protein
MQADQKVKAQIITTALSSSQVFHWTPYEHVQETPTRVQEERGKIEPFNPWLKDKTVFYLQKFTLNQKINKTVYCLASISSNTYWTLSKNQTQQDQTGEIWGDPREDWQRSALGTGQQRLETSSA